jgi:hypothetical protein
VSYRVGRVLLVMSTAAARKIDLDFFLLSIHLRHLLATSVFKLDDWNQMHFGQHFVVTLQQRQQHYSNLATELTTYSVTFYYSHKHIQHI